MSAVHDSGAPRYAAVIGAADRSCQQAVNAWAVSRACEGLAGQSVRTGGYCRARARLPLSMVQALTHESARALRAQAPAGWH